MEPRKIVKYDKMTGQPIYEDEIQAAQNLQQARKIVKYDKMTGQPIYEDELQQRFAQTYEQLENEKVQNQQQYQQMQNQQTQTQQPYQQPQNVQQQYPQYDQPTFQQEPHMFENQGYMPGAGGFANTAGGAANIAGGFASAAGVAGKAAAKGMSAGRKCGIVAAIVALIIAGLSAYFTFFVGTPADTVESFFSSANDMDYQGMIDCLDPSSQAAMSTMMGIGSSVVSGLTGFDIDLESMAALGALIPEEYVGTALEYSNVRTVSITGDKLSGFVSQFGTKIKGIGNALGSEAKVQFDVPNTEKYQSFGTGYVPCSNSKITYEMTVKKYGSDGWCITITDPIVFVCGTD